MGPSTNLAHVGSPTAGAASDGPRPRWRRRTLVVVLVAVPLILGGCQLPTFGAYRGATTQGQDAFKLFYFQFTIGRRIPFEPIAVDFDSQARSFGNRSTARLASSRNGSAAKCSI